METDIVSCMESLTCLFAYFLPIVSFPNNYQNRPYNTETGVLYHMSNTFWNSVFQKSVAVFLIWSEYSCTDRFVFIPKSSLHFVQYSIFCDCKHKENKKYIFYNFIQKCYTYFEKALLLRIYKENFCSKCIS